MARYIDLEELERRINMYVKKPPHSSREIKETTEWCKDECIRQAYCMPTENVALRADVAREIFADIAKFIFSEIPNELMPIYKERDFSDGIILGKRDAFFKVLNHFDNHIRKKYESEGAE